ncbi:MULTISPECIES: glutaredoxin family protein [Deefgea]|uniref:Glutaredoxin family protein n=1 Tax=Deefgea piscis TaxID=2739061 RepID=A0A6M8SUJ8_9NEIS|nr:MULTISPECIES: glutaredoxin family protein [Deefgea]MBM5575506.1 glutaredoxin family protein [Deefgea sp. CFH1-16]QKJ67804.1 glutaredoxin family protein [Deefgea piscis]
MKLKLYGRAYCSLCTQMQAQLLAQAAGRFELEWIDIDDIDELEAKYGEWVPVLLDSDGVEICHYHLDQQALDASLAKIS